MRCTRPQLLQIVWCSFLSRPCLHFRLLSPFPFRVHCFHYLIPLAKEGNYAIVANVESMDYDPLVVKLNKDISAMEEAMSASLQQHKFQYIFEGQSLPLCLRAGGYFWKVLTYNYFTLYWTIHHSSVYVSYPKESGARRMAQPLKARFTTRKAFRFTDVFRCPLPNFIDYTAVLKGWKFGSVGRIFGLVYTKSLRSIPSIYKPTWHANTCM